MAAAMTTGELLERLKRHYIKPGAPLPGGIFLPEVGGNGSWGAARRCDAIYVGFTSSSGRLLVGHELKISRTDWLNELNKPGKADAWADQCHEWWLVVSDPGIVHDGELPAGWGLMVPGQSKTRMKVVQAAERKPASHTPSWQSVRSVMARQDTLRSQAIADIRSQASREAWANQQQRVDDEVARRMRAVPDAKVLSDKLTQIEKALGGRVDFEAKHSYGGVLTLTELAAFGEAARQYGALDRACEELAAGWQLNNIRRALTALETALTALRAAPGTQLELADSEVPA